MKRLLLGLLLLIGAPVYAYTGTILKIVGQGGLGTVTVVDYGGKIYYITAAHVCDIPGRLNVNIENDEISIDVPFKVLRRDDSKHLCLVAPAVDVSLPLKGFTISTKIPRYMSAYGFARGSYLHVPLKFLKFAFLSLDPYPPFMAFLCVGTLIGGMSGGPTLNENEELVGINTAANASENWSLLVPGEDIEKFIKQEVK